MTGRKISWKAKLSLIVFGLCTSLLISELALRFIFTKPQGTEFQSLDDLRRAMLKVTELKVTDNQDPASTSNNTYESSNLRGLITPHLDDNIIYDMIPNLEVMFQRVPVKLNSCGMRSPERSLQKPPNTFRIALLGDSFAFGWGVKQEESFAQVLEDTLNRISNNKPKFEVLNFGTPGYSTFQEVAKFKEIGLKFKPDAVLVFFIENDFGLPFYVRDIYNPGKMLSSMTFARLTWQALDPKIEAQKLKMTNYDPNKALLDLKDFLRPEGIPLYLTINPKKNASGLKRNLWVLKKNKDIRYFDMRPSYKKYVEENKIPDKDLVLSFDPHPSALRHKIYGTILASFFMEWIHV
jgi:hypothetical protein